LQFLDGEQYNQISIQGEEGKKSLLSSEKIDISSFAKSCVYDLNSRI
jgi:hypothetical protein